MTDTTGFSSSYSNRFDYQIPAGQHGRVDMYANAAEYEGYLFLALHGKKSSPYLGKWVYSFSSEKYRYAVNIQYRMIAIPMKAIVKAPNARSSAITGLVRTWPMGAQALDQAKPLMEISRASTGEQLGSLPIGYITNERILALLPDKGWVDSRRPYGKVWVYNARTRQLMAIKRDYSWEKKDYDLSGDMSLCLDSSKRKTIPQWWGKGEIGGVGFGQCEDQKLSQKWQFRLDGSIVSDAEPQKALTAAIKSSSSNGKGGSWMTPYYFELQSIKSGGLLDQQKFKTKNANTTDYPLSWYFRR